MDTMFWVWLGVIVATAVFEIITTDLVSIWFTFGAIIPFILATTTDLDVAWQIAIFLVISAILLASLRKITMKYLFKNSNSKTNLDTIIGQRYRLLEKTDFETLGKVKIKDIEWNVTGDKQQTIKKGKIVEVVKISGNKLIVKEVEDNNSNKKGETSVLEKQQTETNTTTQQSTKTTKTDKTKSKNK